MAGQSNTAGVRRYFEFYDVLNRSSAGSQVDATGHDKPESSPPICTTGFDFMEIECNRVAATLVEPRIRRLLYKAFDEWLAVNRVAGLTGEAEHGVLMHWRAGRGEDAADWLRSFNRGCERIADWIEAEHPGAAVRVRLPDRRDEQAASKHDAAMQDYKARKNEEKRRRYEHFVSLSEEDGKLRRYEATAAAFGVHPDTVRSDVRWYTSRNGKGEYPE